jgi:hypothetical protein
METGFMLNYLTLKVSNKKVATQIRSHREARFTSLSVIFLVFALIAFLYNLIAFFKFNGHPLLVLASGITLASFIIVFYFRFTNQIWKATYMCVPYLLVHVILALCCFKGALVSKLATTTREKFDNHILLNFLIINALPLIDFKWTVFGMVPILLIGTYIQVSA